MVRGKGEWGGMRKEKLRMWNDGKDLMVEGRWMMVESFGPWVEGGGLKGGGFRVEG